MTQPEAVWVSTTCYLFIYHDIIPYNINVISFKNKLFSSTSHESVICDIVILVNLYFALTILKRSELDFYDPNLDFLKVSQVKFHII